MERISRKITMTKADIVERLHQRLGMSKKDAYGHVEALFELMKKTLSDGNRVKITGFGSFDVRQKQDRRGRNPQTGEAITIEARRVLVFKPSPVLKREIR